MDLLAACRAIRRVLSSRRLHDVAELVDRGPLHRVRAPGATHLQGSLTVLYAGEVLVRQCTESGVRVGIPFRGMDGANGPEHGWGSAETPEEGLMRHLLRRAALAAVVLALPLVATPVSAAPFPHVIPIPSDFEPEGIAVGAGSTFYVGSLRSGDIYRGD